MPAPGRILTLVALTLAVLLLSPTPAVQAASPWPGHPGRVLVGHTVRPGETATGLSVRFHAWTREFIALNGSRLRVGERVRIPVVVAAARRAAKERTAATSGARPHRADRPHRAHRPHRTHRTHRAPKAAPRSSASSLHTSRPPGRGWLHADMSREEVRRLVVSTARRLGVPPRLALAVAWQESGWQQRRISSAGAIGVMQVMPDTGRWMRLYVGRSLRLRDTHDNVLAGVRTIKVLMDSTRRDDRAIAAYYQGLGAVRERGLYDDTKHYVAAVRAHEQRITRTGSPV